MSGKKNGERYILNNIWIKFIPKVVLKIGSKHVLIIVPQTWPEIDRFHRSIVIKDSIFTQTCPERLIVSRDLSWESVVSSYLE